MNAQEARELIVAAIREVQEAGFDVGGHWDDEVLLLIHARGRQHGDFRSDVFAKVDVNDADLATPTQGGE